MTWRAKLWYRSRCVSKTISQNQFFCQKLHFHKWEILWSNGYHKSWKMLLNVISCCYSELTNRVWLEEEIMVYLYILGSDFCISPFFTGNRLATISLSSNSEPSLARVRSPWYNRSADGYGKCLKFRYMLLGAGNNSLRLYQIDDIFSRERPIWQDESGGDDSWRYGQVSVSGVTDHQVKRDTVSYNGSWATNGHMVLKNHYAR